MRVEDRFSGKQTFKSVIGMATTVLIVGAVSADPITVVSWAGVTAKLKTMPFLMMHQKIPVSRLIVNRVQYV